MSSCSVRNTTMKTILLTLLSASTALAAVTLNTTSYMKLPSCESGSEDMFLDSAVKAVFDPASRLLYVTGSTCLHVVSIENPSRLVLVYTKFFNKANDGKIVDIALCGNKLALLLESTFQYTEGHFYDCTRFNFNTDPPVDCTDAITVGESPKSMAFTPDCSKLVVANEGRAGTLNGRRTDPDGSITVVTMNSDPSYSRKLSFTHFNNNYLSYIEKGVRNPFSDDVTTTFSQDIEPEAVAISDDGQWAYITLPENNAMAIINLVTEAWDDIYPLGTKAWGGSRLFDGSDIDGGPFLNSYDVRGMYQPTGAVFVTTGISSYVVTANTGAPKVYTTAEQGVDFTDAISAANAMANNLIDQTEISGSLALDLSSDYRLGRLLISNRDGRSETINTLIKTVHLFGGRDIGFFNTATKTFSFTTNDDLEKKAQERYPAVFNGDCSNASVSPAAEMDSRSIKLGPEPNVVVAGTFNRVPLIAAATRNGLIYLYSMAFDSPFYESVYRYGDPNESWDQNQDGLISDMGYINENVLAGGRPHLFVVSKGTGSISLKEIRSE
ncbi:mesenchyme-specific cell surface glycoprotein-like [Argopecten irradians]|uniref:mesenchyme-specific cell surface glycoprotein-like n=1 Tax=Argopecten irradians TaxID=31199 RepID=UPI00371600DA